jgi:hypothetical protein
MQHCDAKGHVPRFFAFLVFSASFTFAHCALDIPEAARIKKKK